MLQSMLVDKSQLLLEDRFAPITSEIGFIAAPRDQVVQAYSDWQQLRQIERNIHLKYQVVRGECAQVLSGLEPLTLRESSKSLFIPVANGWTAYVDNRSGGTDAEAVVLCLSRALQCLGIKMVAAPHTKLGEQKGASGAYGGLAFQLFDPQKNRDLSYCRVLALSNDAGKWEFISIGDPLPFEDTQSYKNRSKIERFTFSHLKAYLAAFDISAFDSSFYRTVDLGAGLLEIHGPKISALKATSLPEVRRFMGIDTEIV